MKIKNLSYHNQYHIQCRNIKTGKLKEAYAYNTMCYGYFNGVLTMYLGLGSGTGEPSYNDSGLFKDLSWPRREITWEKGDYYRDENMTRHVGKVVLPASPSYVGTITEVDIHSAWLAVMSHALLKDAEGNPISIEKTDLDELTVTITVYVKGNDTEQYRYLIAAQNSQYNQNTLPWFFTTNYSYDGYMHLYYLTTKHTWYAPVRSKDYIIWTEHMSSDNNLTALKLRHRLPTTDGNNQYINSIELSSYEGRLLQIPFPNSLVPNYEITGIAIGTGDGSTSNFEPPVPMWVKNTDKIYINGVLKTRDVDYTIDCHANRQNWLSAARCNFIKEYKNTKPITTWPTRYSISNIVIPYTSLICNYRGPAIMADNPIIIEFEDDPCVGNKVNRWIPGHWIVCNTDGSSVSISKLEIILESSSDGNNFIERARYTYNSNTYNQPINITENTDKFYRISCTGLKEGYLLYQAKDHGGLIYYYGEPIKFKNPPVDGAEITMDITFDRPYKNQNFVLDVAMEWQFR